MPAPSRFVSALALDPNGAQILIGGGPNIDQGTAALWDSRTASELRALPRSQAGCRFPRPTPPTGAGLRSVPSTAP